MKKLILMSAIVLGGLGIQNASAQLGIRINVNLGTRPVYAPQPAEVVYDDYYYLPEVEAYYSVGENCYYYQDGERWIAAAYLPGRYHDFNWRTAKRFEIHANRPFVNHNVYRGRFGGFNNRNDHYASAYPNRDRNYNDRDRNQYDNRGGWNSPNRDRDDRRDDRDQRYNQPAPGRNQGGYQQPDRGQGGQQPDRSQGGYNQGRQQQPSQGGYQQPNRGQQPDRSQGGYNQGGQQQPSQGQGQQGGGRGNGQGQQGGGNSQPANQNGGGRDRGNASGPGQQYTANKMGVVNDRNTMNRPVRY